MATAKTTTRRRRSTKGVSGVPSVKQLTNFKGIQGDVTTVSLILLGMLGGKIVNDNVKGLISKMGGSATGEDGTTSGFGRLLGDSMAGKLAGGAVDTVKNIAPALLITLGGFALKKNSNNAMIKDAALGMMAYGGSSVLRDAFKFNLVGKLQGFGKKGMGSLYSYRDRPRMLHAAPAEPVNDAAPVRTMSGQPGFAGTRLRAV